MLNAYTHTYTRHVMVRMDARADPVHIVPKGVLPGAAKQNSPKSFQSPRHQHAGRPDDEPPGGGGEGRGGRGGNERDARKKHLPSSRTECQSSLHFGHPSTDSVRRSGNQN